MEKVGITEKSQSMRKNTRGREEGETVQIVDEKDDEDVENEEDGAPTVDSGGMLTSSFTSFHDGWIILDSVCTVDTLASLSRDYKIPDSISLSFPHRGYDMYTPPHP